MRVPEQHIKKQNGIIKDLKEQLEQAVTSTADANVKAKEEQLAEFKVGSSSFLPNDII